jgi:hypothetical protein
MLAIYERQRRRHHYMPKISARYEYRNNREFFPIEPGPYLHDKEFRIHQSEVGGRCQQAIEGRELRTQQSVR